MVNQVASGIFHKTSDVLIDELRKKNTEEKITFLLPTKYISEEAAKLGFLLNLIFNERRSDPVIYRTFFGSCHWEAISGTIKIIRQNERLKKGNQDRKVLVYDPSGELSEIFNPFDLEEDKRLVPRVQFEKDFDLVKELLQHQDTFSGFICGWDGSLSINEVDDLFQICKKKAVITALDEAHLNDWYKDHTRHCFYAPPDIFITGENLTGYQVPFCSFSMTSEIFSPWFGIGSCLTHSSSYSCNTICLSMALTLFEKHGLIGPEKYIEGNRKEIFKAYARYVNPAIAWIFYVTGLSPQVLRAKGSRLFVQMKSKEEEIIDAVAGSGCCLRGHNPSDLIPEVLEQHDSNQDYWAALCQKFYDMSSLPHVFPAVSGSSAVDIGIILGLLAMPGKTKIVTFKDNYSGKSLISLNLSRYRHFQEPFRPLYFDVLEINPFSTDGKKKLEQELLSGQVALVWFEILQGQNLDFIPEDVLLMINKYQDVGDYLIGIDEILTGMFRTGSFLCSDKKILKPDMITLAKGTSDMVFPTAYVLASDRVYQRAITINEKLVEKLKTHFINQIGAHITLHALEKALDGNLDQHVVAMEHLFKKLLQEAVKKSHFHQEIRGKGLLLYIKLDKKKFPINILGEESIEFLMSSYYLDMGKVLFLNSRLTPSMSISQKDMESTCERIQMIFDHMQPLSLFFFSLKRIIHIYTLCWLQKMKEKLIKPTKVR